MAQSAHQKLAALKAQLAAITVKIAAAETAAANEVDVSRVVAGAVVEFNYGKSPNVVKKTGAVLGVKQPAEGTKGATQIKVAVGEGFEAQTHVIYVAAVTTIVSSPVSDLNAPVAETEADAE